MLRTSRLAMSAAALATLGCAAKTTTIMTEPTGAFVKVGHVNKGDAPVEHEFDFRGREHVIVQATLAGYIPTERLVEKQDIRDGKLRLALEADPAWAETTESEATNRWLRVQVRSDFAPEDMWRRVVDAVTSRYEVIEQLDPVSGYILSAAETRTYQRSGELFRIRTQIVGSVSSEQPLIYRIKIKSHSSVSNGPWMEYDRVFKDDAELIEELQGRLSVR
jgi:hypothetical protein